MCAFISSNLVKVFIPFGIFIWSIFMPQAGGYTYLALYCLFVSYLFIIDSSKPNPDPSIWSSDEIDVLREYHLALRFSFGAKDMSCHLNGFRWIGLLLLTPWLLWNHMWIAGAVLIVFFFVTGSISVRLDPFYFLGDAVNKGQMQFSHELSMLQQVSEKLNERATSQAGRRD